MFKKELTETQEKLNSTLLFTLKLLAAGLIFHIILFVYPDTHTLQVGLAQITNFFLDIIGFNFETQGIYLVGEQANYVITQDCLGWKSMAMFTALVFASSTRFRNHLKFVFGGIMLLITANIVRIVSTVYLSEKGIISFDIIHGVLWKWGLTFIVLVVWIAWFNRTEFEEEAYVVQREIKDTITDFRSEN